MTPLLLEWDHIDLDTRVICNEGNMTADLGGELAILNLKTGVYYGLNEVGARIWALLKEGRSVLEIRNRITEEYAVDSRRCERDLTTLLSELARHDLIELRHAPDRPV